MLNLFGGIESYHPCLMLTCTWYLGHCKSCPLVEDKFMFFDSFLTYDGDLYLDN